MMSAAPAGRRGRSGPPAARRQGRGRAQNSPSGGYSGRKFMAPGPECSGPHPRARANQAALLQALSAGRRGGLRRAAASASEVAAAGRPLASIWPVQAVWREAVSEAAVQAARGIPAPNRNWGGTHLVLHQRHQGRDSPSTKPLATQGPATGNRATATARWASTARAVHGRPSRASTTAAGPAESHSSRNWPLEDGLEGACPQNCLEWIRCQSHPRSGVWPTVATPDCSARRGRPSTSRAFGASSFAGRRPTTIACQSTVVAGRRQRKRQRQQPPMITHPDPLRAFTPAQLQEIIVAAYR